MKNKKIFHDFVYEKLASVKIFTFHEKRKMTKIDGKQLILKPQDLVVALKLALDREHAFVGMASLAAALEMPLSSLHGAIVRCEQARLLTRATGDLRAVRPAVSELIIHGARYVFPGLLGTLTRGIPTAVGGPTLRKHFDNIEGTTPVWPDPTGSSRGPGLVPLYPGLQKAAMKDEVLYDALTLFDALRIGAARERELAAKALEERLA